MYMYSQELPCMQATHYRSKKIQLLLSGHSKDHGIKESVIIHAEREGYGECKGKVLTCVVMHTA